MVGLSFTIFHVFISRRFIDSSCGLAMLDHFREGNFVLFLGGVPVHASSTLQLLLSAVHTLIYISSYIFQITIVLEISHEVALELWLPVEAHINVLLTLGLLRRWTSRPRSREISQCRVFLLVGSYASMFVVSC